VNRQPDCTTLRHAYVQIRRMWEGGPLRQWSEKRTNRTGIALASGGFGGCYVCDGCRMPVKGIYLLRGESLPCRIDFGWVCQPCRRAVRPRKEQPAQLRPMSVITAG